MDEVDHPTLKELRERLVDLWSSFDDNAVRAADVAWRALDLAGAVDEMIDEGFAFPFPNRGSDAEALVELIAIDRVAWELGQPFPTAPYTIVGEYYVVRLARPRRPRIGAELLWLTRFVRHHAIVPRTVSLGVGPATIAIELCRDRTSRWDFADDELRVEAMSFADGARHVVVDDLVSGIEGIDRSDPIRNALDRAQDQGVEVVVFPELTISPPLREVAVRHLRKLSGLPKSVQGASTLARAPLMVLLGSFHERIGDAMFHTTLLVDGNGEAIGARHRGDAWTHVSHRKFSLEPEDHPENVQLGNTLTIFVTPIGLVALAICSDFRASRLRTLWEQAAPDLVLVPARGPFMQRHAARAEVLSREHGTVTVVAHECDDSQEPTCESDHSLVVCASSLDATILEWRFRSCFHEEIGVVARFCYELLHRYQRLAHQRRTN